VWYPQCRACAPICDRGTPDCPAGGAYVDRAYSVVVCFSRFVGLGDFDLLTASKQKKYM
jgi:hypothetical protein